MCRFFSCPQACENSFRGSSCVQSGFTESFSSLPSWHLLHFVCWTQELCRMGSWDRSLVLFCFVLPWRGFWRHRLTLQSRLALTSLWSPFWPPVLSSPPHQPPEYGDYRHVLPCLPLFMSLALFCSRLVLYHPIHCPFALSFTLLNISFSQIKPLTSEQSYQRFYIFLKAIYCFERPILSLLWFLCYHSLTGGVRFH